MDLSPLLASLLKPLLLKPLQKAGVWAARQADGKAKGDAQIAANAPVIGAVEDSLTSAAAGSLAAAALSHVGAAHLTADKLAKSLGIPTTEDGLIAAGVSASKSSTLNLSDPASALSFLASNLVK